MNPISTALLNGYSAVSILQYLKNLSPVLKKKITQAEKIGHAPEKIIDFFSNQMESEFSSSYQTSNKIEGTKKKEYADKVKKGLALGLGTAALGAYAMGRQLTTTPTNLTNTGAVRPSAIYPAQPRPLQMGHQTPRGLPAPQIPGGTQPINPQRPNTPRPNSPTPNAPVAIQPAPPIQTPQVNATPPIQTAPAIAPNIQKSVQVATGLNLMQHIQALRNNLKDPNANAIAGVLYNQFPKEMAKLQKDVGKPMEEVIGDIVSTMPAIQEKPKVQPETPSKPEQLLPQVNYKPDAISKAEEKPKVSGIAFGAEPLKKLSEAKSLEKYSFSMPTYKFSDESEENYRNREIINSAIEKAAKALGEGKTFLDFPMPWGESETTSKTISRGPRKGVTETETKIKDRFARSSAADVLRYLSGLPNVYSALLDDDEKEELNNSLEEEGYANLKAALPAGDGNIYGATMTPNLVWNMLLSVEPRLQNIKIPKSVKGYPKLSGDKMGTTELRRNLTHAVYGALSGKKITNKLADKINKISQVSNSIDVMAEASKQGKLNEMLKEQERLLEDDEYFFNLYADEILEQAKKLR